MLQNRFWLLGLFCEDKLISIHLQPRIKLDDQIALILIFKVRFDLAIIFALEGVIIPEMMVESLEDKGELVLEVFVLLGLGRAWVFEFGREVEGGLEVFLYVRHLDVSEERVHDISLL